MDQSVFCAKKVLKRHLNTIGKIISRYCGEAVCSQCSKNYVSKLRACDVCVFKL